MSNEVLEKLAQLLEQDQFELIFTEQDIRLVYLMNDAVEISKCSRRAEKPVSGSCSRKLPCVPECPNDRGIQRRL